MHIKYTWSVDETKCDNEISLLFSDANPNVVVLSVTDVVMPIVNADENNEMCVSLTLDLINSLCIKLNELSHKLMDAQKDE